MIGMHEHVGNKEVIIPHHTVGKVALQCAQGGLSEV